MSTENSKDNTQTQVATPNLKSPVIGVTGKKIVYDENGKPCRTCNSLLDFRKVNQAQKGAVGALAASSASASEPASTEKKAQDTVSGGYAKECPADVNELGKSSWTLLHTIAATYPPKPTEEQQTDMSTFISLFSKIYPCWFCAKDFQEHIKKDKPKVKTQEEFGRWLCDAHNEVNVKLGKPKFDCNLWKQRWKDGWEDGRCD